ncbi:MAG TPA: DMT family transporter [Clostridiaceae bacterium]|nr:DMT family transporter [Clostridiaceae bacterium]
MNRYIVGILLVILSGICYGFTPVLAVYAYQGGATVSEYVFLRYVVASAVYLLYITIYKRNIFSMLGTIPVVLLLAAGTSQAVAAYLYMSAVKSISAGLAAVLFYTYILWVAVWGFVFNKERLKLSGIAGVALALIGLVMVVGVSWGKICTIGIFMGLAAALALSGFVMTSNGAMKKLEPIAASAFICILTAAPLFLLGSATGTLNYQMSTVAWLACVATGIFTSIALFAFMAGMKLVGSTTASVLCTAEPVTAVVFSALLLSQKMSALQLFGGLVILIGAVLVVTSKRQPDAGDVQLSKVRDS